MRFFRFKEETNRRHGYVAQDEDFSIPSRFCWVDAGEWRTATIEGWNGYKILELVEKGTWEELKEVPWPRGDWHFERSSGYAGWRCAHCGNWIYSNQRFICSCDL